MPKISIIIPVFNAEQYLQKCLNSIINQSFIDWECILVDDGSIDCSGIICDHYSSFDRRFKVYHKENGGVSSARNLGLEKIEGEWVFFSDADDYLESDALEILYSHSQKGVDGVWGGFKKYDTAGNRIEESICTVSKQITVVEAITYLYNSYIYEYNGYLWNKLFKKAVIHTNNLSFDIHIPYNEDSLFITKYLCVITKPVWFTTQTVYNYILRETGAMESLRKNPRKRFTSLIAYHKQYLSVLNSPYSQQCKKIALDSCWSTYKFLIAEMIKGGFYTDALRKELKALYFTLLGKRNYYLNVAVDYIKRIKMKIKYLNINKYLL